MISDLTLILITWIVLALWQLIGFSWAFRFYRDRLFDSAWGFGRLISWLLLSLPIWFLAHLGLPVNQSVFFYLLFFGLSINTVLYFEKEKKLLAKFLKKRWKLILTQELLFLIFFVFLCVIRGHQPRVEGLEKFMDVGFIAGYLRSPTLPAEDMWLAGEKINYYTFGHFLGAVATRFFSVEVETSYNLMLGMIMGLVAIQAASFSGNLVYRLKDYSKKIIKSIDLSALIKVAILSGFLLVLAGNGHTSWHFLSKGSFIGYWYPDATRFIERTIHEFPAYSFVVSDLHAHVWSMPLVIFIMLNIYLWVDSLLNYKDKGFQLSKIFKIKKHSFNLFELLDTKATDCFKAVIKVVKILITRCSLPPDLHKESFFRLSLLIGALLGIAISTSTWDFLVYSLLLTVLGLMLLISNKKRFWQLFVSAFAMVLTALLIASPWLLNFVSISEGVALAKEHSPLWQLAVLWLPHLLLSLVVTIIVIQLARKKGKISSREMMIVGMIITSIVLLVLPEIIYMKDIYPNHPRANTMFKLTFQAFIMMTLAISTLLGIVGTQEFKKKIGIGQQLITKVLILLFILSNGYYAFFGYRDFYGGLKKYQSLNGLSWLELSSPSDYRAIIWLRKNIEGRPVILEAVGESYTTFARVSTFTGLPTVLGWRVHEWLWRGGFDIPSQRTEEVQIIYLDPDSLNSQQLLKRYNIEYIFIGEKEREAYGEIDELGLSQLGEIVFSSGDTRIIHIE